MVMPRFDELIHARTRLSIVALLGASDWAEFRFIRESLGLSDSVVSKQLTLLENAGYVEIRKAFVGKRPRTWVKLSPTGRLAFEGHVRKLQEIALQGGTSLARDDGSTMVPDLPGPPERAAASSPDARTYLDMERDAWHPFEVLAALPDEQLTVPVAAAHGWTGRQLMAHLLSGHEMGLAVATELAGSETSPAKERADADWDARGGDAVNAEIDARWAALSMAELRDRFATLPDQLRAALIAVPESRWVHHDDHRRFFRSETTAHYEDHLDDLAAILATARR